MKPVHINHCASKWAQSASSIRVHACSLFINLLDALPHLTVVDIFLLMAYSSLLQSTQWLRQSSCLVPWTELLLSVLSVPNIKWYHDEKRWDRLYAGPYLRMGPRGPSPGRQIFRGGILKKSRLKYGIRKKRLSTREKFKGDLYWKQCWYRVFSLRRYWR